MIVCAGNNETFSFATPIGIGLVNSAINLTEICISVKPKNILFIGSAGSYGKAKIFDIVTSNIATNVEIGYYRNSSYSPIFGAFEGIYNNVSCETLDKNLVNSSNFITTCKEEAKLFSDNNLYIENMEFFSVISVAKKFKIPSFGLFCVTNFCDENAHADFMKNHKKAKELLEIEFLEKYQEFI
ncbi:MAG: purine-nucleoside phosphorylase [Campylobacteraceae bacterium]